MNRIKALKGLIFHTSDSSFWISNLIEGRLSISMRPEYFPKPAVHFLDDSQIEYKDENTQNDQVNHTLSEKAPENLDENLKYIEKKLFEENSPQIEENTMKMISKISVPKEFLFGFLRSSQMILLLGCMCLLGYNVISISLSYLFLIQIKLYSEFWTNLIFASSIVSGVLISCMISIRKNTRNMIFYHFLALIFVSINFQIIEFHTNSFKENLGFISISQIQYIRTFVIVMVLSSLIGNLMIYTLSLFFVRSRAIVLLVSFSLSYWMLTLMKIDNYGQIFMKGIELELFFIFTIFGAIVVTLMPENISKQSKKEIV
jgi:hypothetical protein